MNWLRRLFHKSRAESELAILTTTSPFTDADNLAHFQADA